MDSCSSHISCLTFRLSSLPPASEGWGKYCFHTVCLSTRGGGGGVPHAFTQEDILVIYLFTYFFICLSFRLTSLEIVASHIFRPSSDLYFGLYLTLHLAFMSIHPSIILSALSSFSSSTYLFFLVLYRIGLTYFSILNISSSHPSSVHLTFYLSSTTYLFINIFISLFSYLPFHLGSVQIWFDTFSNLLHLAPHLPLVLSFFNSFISS